MFEIERKFLLKQSAHTVISTAQAEDSFLASQAIEQSYLLGTGDWVLRRRRVIDGESITHFLTMKRRLSGVQCVELETEIEPELYAQIASQCGPTLRKLRSKILHANRIWEIDVFENPELAGLEFAEIELSSADETFISPPWAGDEVTDSGLYKNDYLVQRIAA